MKFDQQIIGIANSVARDENYSWDFTIAFAQSLTINHLQLYLNDEISEIDILQLKDKIPGDRFIIFHLPAHSNFNPSGIKFIARHFTNAVFIQHHQWITPELVNFFGELHLCLGIENDYCGNLSDFLQKITEIYSSGIEIKVVMDCSRYFLQHWETYTFEEITSSIFGVLKYCQASGVDLIYHVVDQPRWNHDRDHWKPLFEGEIPWKGIFKFSFSRNKISSIIFEYEETEMCRQSINNFKKWVENV